MPPDEQNGQRGPAHSCSVIFDRSIVGRRGKLPAFSEGTRNVRGLSGSTVRREWLSPSVSGGSERWLRRGERPRGRRQRGWSGRTRNAESGSSWRPLLGEYPPLSPGTFGPGVAATMPATPYP